MASGSPTSPRRSPYWLLRPGDQAAAAMLVFGCLAATMAWCVFHGTTQEGLVELDDAAAQTATFWVDINRAGWPELSQLPGIGKTLAGRIIESRQTEGPFRSHDDLVRVHGIGPKTLDAVRPYLRPLGDGDEGADGLPPPESR